MPLLTLCQAAKAVKKSKSTLLDAINSQRLNAFKNQRNQWQIDLDELFRVYPSTEREPNGKTESVHEKPNKETALLQQQVEFLEQRVSDIKDERDDLRRRLNEEVEERRKLTELITNVFDDHVLSLYRTFDLTPDQYNIFTILVKGKDVIPNIHHAVVYYPPSNAEIISDLTKIGVLIDRQVSEKFTQVQNSILQDRSVKEITLNDFVNIAKRYSDWKPLPSPRSSAPPSKYNLK